MHITIIGAGAWGTALAATFARAHQTTLWAFEPDVADSINQQQENTRYLPGIKLPKSLKANSSLEKSIQNAELLLLVPPAQHVRKISELLSKLKLGTHIPILIAAKGIEQNTLKLMPEIVAEFFPKNPIAMLSGPSFAEEVAHGLPVAVSLACPDIARAEQLAHTLGTSHFRIYHSDDVIGVALGGAVKNVIAIACGVVHGAGLGHNTLAAVVTRGLSEIRRIGAALGAKPETFMGLSGIGDLMLTCTSLQSRNMSLGSALGQGKKLSGILNDRGAQVTEGVATAESLHMLAKKLKLDLPIAEAVYQLLHQNIPAQKIIESLLARPLKAED